MPLFDNTGRSPTDTSVNRNTPRTRKVGGRSLVRALDGRDYQSPIPVYYFDSRTFYERDTSNIVS